MFMSSTAAAAAGRRGVMSSSSCVRQYVAQRALRVRWLPPELAAATASSTSEPLLAVASAADDDDVYYLAVIGVGDGGEALEWAGAWQHPTKPTHLSVAQAGSSQAALVTGSVAGSLARLRLDVASSQEGRRVIVAVDVDLDVGDMDGDGGAVAQWALLHSGPVAGVDVWPHSLDVASAGADGRIAAINLAHEADQAQHICDNKGMLSYSGVRWASSDALVAATTSGKLHVWDRRQQRIAQSIHPGAGHRIHDLRVDRSRPHLVATGGSGGKVAVWDLRATSKPLGQQVLDSAWEVWEVQFDHMRSGRSTALASSGSVPRVLACCEGGTLECVDLAGGVGRDVLADEAGVAINTFDVDPLGEHVACATDSECLLYMRRTPKY